MFKDLETERLYLKRISIKDRDFIFNEFSIHDDNDINNYLFDAEPMTTLEEADWLVGFYTTPEPRSQQRWILTLKSTGEKIGTCGFHCWDMDKGYSEIGYDMLKCFRGHGYMTEAVAAIITFGKNDMKLKHIDAHIYEGNEASKKLSARCGFYDSGETTVYNFRGVDYIHNVYRYEIK